MGLWLSLGNAHTNSALRDSQGTSAFARHRQVPTVKQKYILLCFVSNLCMPIKHLKTGLGRLCLIQPPCFTNQSWTCLWMTYQGPALFGGKCQGSHPALSPRPGSTCYVLFLLCWIQFFPVFSPPNTEPFAPERTTNVGGGEKSGCLILLFQLDPTSNQDTRLCWVSSVIQLLRNTENWYTGMQSHPKALSQGFQGTRGTSPEQHVLQMISGWDSLAEGHSI